MKKALSLLLMIIMCCISLVACKSALDIRQELVNICCDFSNCNSVKWFEIATDNTYETDNGYEVKAIGSYWPVNEYGSVGDQMIFDIEFTATWDSSSSCYDIDINKKVIMDSYEARLK